MPLSHQADERRRGGVLVGGPGAPYRLGFLQEPRHHLTDRAVCS
jgi:hypothetical protein